MKMVKGIGFLLALSGFVLGCSKGQNFGVGDTQQKFMQDATYNDKVDILWVVDDSPTMVAKNQKLADEMPSLIDAFNQMHMNYHLAVTTVTMSGTNPTGGHFVGSPKYITSSDPGVAGEISSRLVATSAGSSAERAFDSIKAVLQPSYLSGEGAGFLRPDSVLVVVAVSDEDDISTVSTTQMESILDTLRPKSQNGEQNWFMNYIGSVQGLTPCPTNALGTIVLGIKYSTLVTYTKGTQASLCDNSLSSAVSGIKKRLIQILTDYKLRNQPDLSTVKVYVNGVLVPQDATNGWTYVSATNVIHFNGTSVPPVDAHVDVDYTPLHAN